ncbi:hypothetical protein IJ556_00820, partial [bacterium]|nr:hypothetical protein [bacterium]
MFDGIRESISSAVDSAAGKISEMVSQVEETAQEVIEEVSETVSSVAEVSIFSSEEDNAPSVETEISHPESENQPEYSASVPVERPLELENIQNEYNNAADIQENNSSDGMFGSVVNFISDTANSVISAISPFSKAEAASVPNSNPSKLVNEPDNFKEDERIQDDKEGNNYITVQSWGDDDSQNDCLENIIKNSYDLEAMGIQYGSEEYYELQNEIMKSNPEIFAQNGVNSVLYDNDKIKLPSFKTQKQTTEENNQKEQTDSLKTSMQSMLEQEERELNAEKKSGGLWDSAKSLFGYGTNEQEKIINEKKAALAKAMASGNEEDLINAYKLINKDKPVYIDAAGKIVDVSALSEEETKKYNKTTVGDLTSNENIASLMQNEGKKTKEAEDNIKAIEMGLVECNGQPVSMEQISSILKAQTENTEQNFNNAAKRQGHPGKFVSFVNNYLGLGTTKDDMKAQIDLQKQLIKELEQCKNPSEYAAKFKQVTGQDFNSSSIMQLLAYNQLTSGESVNPSENTPKSGKIDIGSGVTNIAEAVKKDNKGNKDVLSLTQNSKAQKFIDEYKDTQKAVKNGAIGIITAPISLAAMSFAPFTGGLSLLVGAGVGAALSTGINAIDSIYDADGDGSLDFNYTRDDLLKDGLIGSANGFFLGTGSLVKNALFSFAKAKLANTAAQRLMTPALEKLINNQAAKMTGKLANTAATNFVDGAGYAGTAYTVETAFDKNAEFSGEKLVESMIEGGSMGSALGVGGHAVMKAASNTPKVISKAADKLPDVSGKFSEIASKANAKIEQAADKAADKIINAEAKLENA